MIHIEIGIALIIVAYAFLYIKIALIHRSVMMDRANKMSKDADYLLSMYCNKFNIPKNDIKSDITIQDIINAFKKPNYQIKHYKL